MFGPLDRSHTISPQILIEPQACKGLRGLDTVQIEMVERDAATVSVHDGKGRTTHVRGRIYTKPAGQSPDEEGFTCSELAGEGDHVARIHKSAHRLPQRARLLGRGGVIDGHPLLLKLASHSFVNSGQGYRLRT